MSDSATTSKLKPGSIVAPFQVDTLAHGRLALPSSGVVHLQFRRFAGCPICNLHLRQFAREQGRLEAAGVKTVAFVHSSAEAMRPYQGDLPFATVPDAEKHWYRQFGVERSAVAMFHPRALWAAIKGSLTVKHNPLAGEGGMTGLPADFLLDAQGTVLALKYGAHPDDAWSVDEVIALVQPSKGQVGAEPRFESASGSS
ncbi:MAG: AhpC/TSA family protein [Myxococcaceae bacterium]|nr:AhpC/TSA family protein [Myxococcaceae bacterium]